MVASFDLLRTNEDRNCGAEKGTHYHCKNCGDISSNGFICLSNCFVMRVGLVRTQVIKTICTELLTFWRERKKCLFVNGFFFFLA